MRTLQKPEVEAIRKRCTGQRIKFISHSSPDPAPMSFGDTGTCIEVDDFGTLMMRWDNGRCLGLTPGDRYEVIDK